MIIPLFYMWLPEICSLPSETPVPSDYESGILKFLSPLPSLELLLWPEEWMLNICYYSTINHFFKLPWNDTSNNTFVWNKKLKCSFTSLHFSLVLLYFSSFCLICFSNSFNCKQEIKINFMYIHIISVQIYRFSWG